MRYFNTLYLTIPLLLAASAAQAQTLTIDSCHALLERNYPIARQRALIQQSAKVQADAFALAYVPQLSLAAQASYQNDVTHIDLDFPGFEFPRADKDQYQLYAEVRQLVWDGGEMATARRQNTIENQIASAQVNLQMHKLHAQVDELYFALLLTERQIELHQLLEEELARSQKRVHNLVLNGVASPVDSSQMAVAVLQAQQQRYELADAHAQQLQALANLLHVPLDSTTSFIAPPPLNVSPNDTIRRPEVDLAKAKIRLLEEKERGLNAKIYPKLALIARGGYGRPALNMLSNKFEPYYLVAAQVQWRFMDLYIRNCEKKVYKLQATMDRNAHEAFTQSVQLELQKTTNEKHKYQTLLEQDDAIIRLRESVKEATAIRFDNGTVPLNELLQTVTLWQQARLTKALHEIMLLRTDYQLRNTIQ